MKIQRIGFKLCLPFLKGLVFCLYKITAATMSLLCRNRAVIFPPNQPVFQQAPPLALINGMTLHCKRRVIGR